MKLTIASLLTLLFFFTPSLYAKYQVEPPRQPDEKTYDKLEQLKKKADVNGILRLWETVGYNPDTSQPFVDYNVNAVMAHAILSFTPKKFIPVLLEGMKSEKVFVTVFCLDTLTSLKDKRALKYVIEMPPIKPLTKAQRQLALELAKDLESTNHEKCEAAKAKLADMGPAVSAVLREYAPARPAALYTIQQVIWDANRLTYAMMHSIAALGDPKDAELIRPFLKQEPYVSSAINALGILKDAASVPDLIAFLDKPKYSNDAATALGIIGDKSAIAPLEKAMNAQKTLHEKQYFIDTLAKLGQRKYLRDAITSATDKDLDKCANSLYLVCDNNDVPLILARMEKTEDYNALHWLAGGLKRIAAPGDEKAINAVRRARKIAEAAKAPEYRTVDYPYILMALGDKDEEKAALAMLDDKDPKVRYAALSRLGAQGKYLPIFIKFLDDKGSWAHSGPIPPGTPYEGVVTEVRRAAINAIITIADNPYLDLRYFDRDQQVRDIKEWYAKYRKEQSAGH